MDHVRQGIVKRLIAAVIDGLILAVIGFVLGLVLAKAPYVAGVVGAATGLAYMGLEVVRGQTVGKMILKLRITDVTGQPATPAALLERYAVKNAASFVVLAAAITGLGFLGVFAMVIGLAVTASALMMLRPDRLAGHDIVAGTAVYGPTAMEFSMPTMPTATAKAV